MLCHLQDCKCCLKEWVALYSLNPDQMTGFWRNILRFSNGVWCFSPMFFFQKHCVLFNNWFPQEADIPYFLFTMNGLSDTLNGMCFILYHWVGCVYHWIVCLTIDLFCHWLAVFCLSLNWLFTIEWFILPLNDYIFSWSTVSSGMSTPVRLWHWTVRRWMTGSGTMWRRAGSQTNLY